MNIPEQIKSFLEGKEIVCNADNGRTITITKVWDFVPADESVGIFQAGAMCTTSEGNEVGVWEDGYIYDDDDKLIATIESQFGMECPEYRTDEIQQMNGWK